MLKLSPTLTLPLEAVTQTIAILAKRRAGKSYLARRLAEQIFAADQQVVIVDPKGDWGGIRSSADGKSPGLPIVMLGGERGDVPLEVGAGEIVAKLIAEDRVSALLDLSLFRKHELATFMAEFLENLYRIKARDAYRTPMMLFIDEADAIAPQSSKQSGMKGGNQERMLGAAQDIVRRGGQRGIGSVLITQRSAVLNKDVLTQAQVLITLRTIAPQDLKAMDAWIDVHGTPDERRTLMESLPSLPIGDAWVWSPGWPTDHGIFQRIHVLPITTFDSGATPRPGERRIVPRRLADVDLGALKERMAATIERAKAEDPKELRRRIADLERELKKANTFMAQGAAPEKIIERVEVPAPFTTPRETSDGINRACRMLEEAKEVIIKAMVPLVALEKVRPARIDVKVTGESFTAGRVVREAPVQRTNGGDTERLGAAHRAFLTTLANRQSKDTARNQLAILSRYSSASSHVDNTISSLRTRGLLVGGPHSLRITDEGLAALGDYERLPSGDALRDYWVREMGAAGGKFLRALIDAYPGTMTRNEVAEAAGYSTESSHVDNTLSALRTRELIEGGPRELRASKELMES